MGDLTEREKLLAAIMLDEVGGRAFVELAGRRLRERQAELGIDQLADVSPDYRNQLLGQAIEEAAVSLLPGLDPDRIQSFVAMARPAWEMDAKATVVSKPGESPH